MTTVLYPLARMHTWVLHAGRQLAWIALALMVVVILVQVFARYILGNALAWPDEAARFLMLWMIGLSAPSAMRWSGFVAIDTLPSLLPRTLQLWLTLVLLVFSLTVLVFAIGLGYDHTFGFGGTFDSSSLKIPLAWLGGENITVKLRYMYGSLFACVVLLASVTFELILRVLVQLFQPDAKIPDDGAAADIEQVTE